VIEPGTEAAFLAARPVRDLPGIGPKSATLLNSFGVHHVGDLLDPQHEPFLRQQWAIVLPHGKRCARNRSRSGRGGSESKSLGHETTFERDTDDMAFLEQTIRGFLGTLAHEMRVQD